MYTLLSPSKSLDFSREHILNNQGTISPFLAETAILHEHLKNYTQEELATLMHVSEKIAALNHSRYAQWSADFTHQERDVDRCYNFLPALLAFTGDVYKGFDLGSYTGENKDFLQSHLGILSGFYGLLRPLDYMRAYRLEMGMRMSFEARGENHKNLYPFWRETLTQEVDRRAGGKDSTILNLASREYSDVIDRATLTAQIIDVDFKIQKGDTCKIIGIYAKKARGQMAHWLLSEKFDHVDAVKKFSFDGWVYDDHLSTITNLVFIKTLH